MTQETTPQEVDLYSPLDPDALPDDPVVLKQVLLQLVSMLRKETKRREEVERNLDLLLRKLTSPKPVGSSPGQIALFDIDPLVDQVAVPSAVETTPDSGGQRKHTPHGRRRPPANLEQVDVIHDLPEEVKAQLGVGNLIPLPDVITFQYDYQAAKLRVIRHLQKKYLRRETPAEASADETTKPAASIDITTSVSELGPADSLAEVVRLEANEVPTGTDTRQVPSAGSCGPDQADGAAEHRTVGPERAEPQAPAHTVTDKVVTAPKRLALPSCEAAPGLLAFVWLSKYGDHLPLYRLETITQRYGISFSRSTTCGWMMELGEVLHPLWQLMAKEVLLSRVIHTDDTTVPLQDPDTGQRSTARFWNYIGDEQHALTVFEFTRTHERIGPATFLANYCGYLQADAYNGYDGLYLEPGGRIIEVGCWQHARKRYKEAVASDMRASCGLAFIKSLYVVEDKIRKLRHTDWCALTLDERAARVVEIRQRESVPILKSFRQWIDKTIGNTLPKSKLGEALRYTLNQWEALNQYPSCGLLDIDNNEAERAHRAIAIGRNNWVFVGSERGGHAAATHFSLLASCKMNAVEPFAYLVDVLTRLPLTPSAELAQLLPNRWRPQPTS